MSTTNFIVILITLVIFNFTVYASEDFNPAQIESIKIDGEVKDIQWSEDGNFLLVLSTDDIFYLYQLQGELSTFSLNLHNIINLNCHEAISNFKPIRNNGIIIAGCFHHSGNDDVIYYDYNTKTVHKITEFEDFSRVNISLGYSNRVLVISSGTKIKVFAVDGFDLILVYDISDFYVTRYVPYIKGLVLDDNSSRIVISDSEGLLWKIDYDSYIMTGKNEIVIQNIEGLNNFRLNALYYTLGLELYDEETLLVKGATEDGMTLWDLETQNPRFSICAINTFSTIQDVIILNDYSLIGFIDGESDRYLLFTQCIDNKGKKTGDIYKINFYSKNVDMHLSWNAAWKILAISSEGEIQIWTI